ncbi:MAG: type II secretion system minor pseudopilin GspI [Halofilum sp. (in: g-proteobacteria)]|nr:type II secretion system minor pseudopilin GspI [Halofilum sp. (in: g-proteobacteria)]
MRRRAHPHARAPRHGRRAAGFTLLEVLVALAVLATTLTALVLAGTHRVDTVAYTRDRTIATWIASDRITELRLARSWPDTGTREGSVEAAGRTWRWSAEISNTPDEHVRRVELDGAPRRSWASAWRAWSVMSATPTCAPPGAARREASAPARPPAHGVRAHPGRAAGRHCGIHDHRAGGLHRPVLGARDARAHGSALRASGPGDTRWRRWPPTCGRWCPGRCAPTCVAAGTCLAMANLPEFLRLTRTGWPTADLPQASLPGPPGRATASACSPSWRMQPDAVVATPATWCARCSMASSGSTCSSRRGDEWLPAPGREPTRSSPGTAAASGRGHPRAGGLVDRAAVRAAGLLHRGVPRGQQ